MKTHAYYATSTGNPETFITLNRNRQKLVGNQVFLHDGSEFEIELNNRTSDTVLAKIKLNGNYISNTGLVLRPGEKVHLERYLDSNRKFLFETYTVESGNASAIRNNGLVEVEYYKEKVLLPVWIDHDDYRSWGYWLPPRPSRPFDIFYMDATSSSIIRCSNKGSSNLVSNSSFGTWDQNSNTLTVDTVDNFSFTDAAPEIETGRVEEGSQSDQHFHTVNKSFDTWAFYTETFQIMPVSQKPKKVVKIYCVTNTCGRRQRHGDVFCPKCGQEY